MVLNSEAVRKLLKSPEIVGMCTEHAKQKAAAAGAGYEVETFMAQTRFVARTKAAKEDNLLNNTMLKVLGRND